MPTAFDALPNDIATLRTALLAARARAAYSDANQPVIPIHSSR